jgi:hypothetical protein
MTLIEVCIGLFLFTLVAGGLLGSLVFARRMSIAALYESSALVSAQGYMEQMKAMTYSTLSGCRTAGASILTVTGTGATESLTTSDNSDVNPGPNIRRIDIFGHYNQTTPPAGAPDVLKIYYTVKITGIPSSDPNPNRLLIQLTYTWETGITSGSSTTRTGRLSLIRNDVVSTVNSI